jgi:hypothetical protein
MKKHFLLLVITIFTVAFGYSQTNVSGGIFVNTTWTQANSPYIVTDTVVVFPGIKLTIQPGVTVKFANGKFIEIRGATLLAVGTNIDSVKFTSNSTSPSTGIYRGIVLDGAASSSTFNYCSFKYADTGINDNRGGSGDTIFIRHATFNLTNTGFNGQGSSYGIIDSSDFKYNVNNGATNLHGTSVNNSNFLHNQTGLISISGSRIDNSVFNYNQTAIGGMSGSMHNCIIKHNQSGISMNHIAISILNSVVDSNAVVGIKILSSSSGDSIYNCQITNNGVGINDAGGASFPIRITKNNISSNATGILLSDPTHLYMCNRICNNSTYDLKYTGSSNTTNVKNNYWCTSDSASTQPLIYDAHNNISYGIVYFMPLDSTCSPVVTGIWENSLVNSFSVYPNPSNGIFTISSKQNISLIIVSDVLGQIVSESKPHSSKVEITIEKTGIYFVTIKTGTQTTTKKVIVTDK